MDYIPHTELEVQEMLRDIGVADFENLLADIPKQFRAKPLELPEALGEQELRAAVTELARKNHQDKQYRLFLGAGAYEHFVPSVVGHLTLRGEFFTAYTPYQPEASQGTLQAIYEYQSMICELTGMDVSNASLYDGATAAAEAMLVALNEKQGAPPYPPRTAGRDCSRVLVSSSLHPDWRAVLRTYAHNRGVIIEEIPFVGGVTDVAALKKALTPGVACLIAQSPNFFGALEPMAEMGAAVHEAGGLFVAAAYPISLGLLAPPSEAGADIVVGEGQCLGNALGFGGPYLGIFACKDFLKRRLPGRVVGETVDKNGLRGYVLTMQAREQHIRREKATSNICTNQSLLALAASIYLSSMGKQGFRRVAEINVERAHQLQEGLAAIAGVHAAFAQPFFNEFVIRLDKSVEAVQKILLESGFIAGLDLGKCYPALKDHLLLCATETKSEADISAFVSAFAGAMR